MRLHTKFRRHQKKQRIRKKKLSRAVQLAVLSMSVSPSIALADVQLDEGSGAAASALTTITNTGTITPAADYLNVDGANTQLTGGVTNSSSGSINAGGDAIELDANSTISGAITNSGIITAGGDAFSVSNSTISGAITNRGTITAGDDAFDVDNNSTISGAITNESGPTVLALTRQNVPVFPRGEHDGETWGSVEGVARGGYVLLDTDGEPDVVLMATGSEVQLAVEARGLLAEDGIAARVVSLPCLEWFEEQDQSYRDTVLPPQVKARVSVEAGVKMGWREYVGDAGRIVSIDHYGASADYARLFAEYGFTARAVADAARDSISAAG